jgi:hypothetical protein
MLFLQVGMGSMDHYERDFEEVLLNDTACRMSIFSLFCYITVIL